MRLTSYSDYALRLLMFAAAKEQSFLTIAEVSTAYRISKNHLMKIVHDLSLAGFLETVRGRNGGLRLAKLPGDIRIGQILRVTESASPLVECFDSASNTCVVTRACKLKFALKQAQNDFFSRLDQFTLADLVSEPRSFLKLLKSES